MRLRAAAIACALLGLALPLSSCGGEDGTATGSPPRPGSKAAARQIAPRSSCDSQLGDFVDALASLRGDLARGLSYTEYLPAVHTVRASYRAIDPRKLTASCLLLSGGPAEHAFNLYIDAANAWGACLTTPSCSTASVEPKLQREWSQASSQLSKAQRAAKGPSG
jgi:hypothetical protein